MGGLGVIMAFASCTTHYQLTTIDRSRILIDQRYDVRQDAKAVAFLAPYRHQVDSIMGPVVAHSDHYMKAVRPESDLSNLLADIMVWGAKAYNEKVDFAVYNMGGIRAGLPAGDVTYGDVLDIAPFENKICFLTLTGDKVMELFNQIAHVGGEGVSKGVSLVLSKNKGNYEKIHIIDSTLYVECGGNGAKETADDLTHKRHPQSDNTFQVNIG